MFCDKCGKELEPGSIFCPNCGAKQPENTAAPKAPESESQPIQQKTPAAEPAPAQKAPPEPQKTVEEPIQSLTPQSASPNNDTAYRTIIAKNADYYLPQFQDIAHGGKGKLNWASFFLTLYHAAYRGVWREWLRAVMWPLILDAVCALLACVLIGSHPDAAFAFVLVAACGGIWWIVANILFAKRFNRVYKAHVEQKIAQHNITPDPSGKRVVWAVLAYFTIYIITSMIVGALSVGSLMAGVDDSAYDDTDTNDSSAYDVPEDNDKDTSSVPDTSGSTTGTNVYDYLGYWRVDRYNSYLDGFIGFNLESNNDILCFSAQAVWNQGDRVTTIDTVSLDMNYDGTQAGGYYQDDRGNDGNIVLDFENGELYLTVTCRSGGNWAMTMEHEHCTKDTAESLSDAMSTLSEAQINAITYRIYEENEFGASAAMQGQIMNRQNWRNYKQPLLDTLVDRIGYYDLSGIDSDSDIKDKLSAWMTVLPNDPDTGVITCQISRASFEQWMAANYDVDTSIPPQSGIYDSNNQCIIHGSQGYIEDDINIYNIRSIDDSTFYVQFGKTYPTDSTSDGYGYAVVHMDNLDDQHFTIWELGWDTESISEQSLAAYTN